MSESCNVGKFDVCCYARSLLNINYKSLCLRSFISIRRVSSLNAKVFLFDLLTSLECHTQCFTNFSICKVHYGFNIDSLIDYNATMSLWTYSIKMSSPVM
jgi:hypothetical protein